MESSFKKAYEKTVGPDGTVMLKFKAERIGAHVGGGVATFLLIPLFLASCAVTYPVATVFGNIGRKDATAITVWNILAVALLIVVVRWYNIRPSTLTLKPHEGVIFNGKQLPFRDIQSISTVHETTGTNPKGNAYVSAQSHGSEIKLTRYMKKDLADAIAREIRSAGGSA